MKLLYKYDSDMKLIEIIESNDNKFIENTTDVSPTDGLYDPTWNGQEWVGKTLDEFLADNPEMPDEPSQQEQLNATVLAQIAQNKADQDKFNAQVLLAIANKGGN